MPLDEYRGFEDSFYQKQKRKRHELAELHATIMNTVPLAPHVTADELLGVTAKTTTVRKLSITDLLAIEASRRAKTPPKP